MVCLLEAEPRSAASRSLSSYPPAVQANLSQFEDAAMLAFMDAVRVCCPIDTHAFAPRVGIWRCLATLPER